MTVKYNIINKNESNIDKNISMIYMKKIVNCYFQNMKNNIW